MISGRFLGGFYCFLLVLTGFLLVLNGFHRHFRLPQEIRWPNGLAEACELAFRAQESKRVGARPSRFEEVFRTYQ